MCFFSHHPNNEKAGHRTAYTKKYVRDMLIDHRAYIGKYGEDMPEIRSRTWLS
jgi:xylulose-5-phosphate/fructose-6-phosphate phosphoketolase